MRAGRGAREPKGAACPRPERGRPPVALVAPGVFSDATSVHLTSTVPKSRQDEVPKTSGPLDQAQSPCCHPVACGSRVDRQRCQKTSPPTPSQGRVTGCSGRSANPQAPPGRAHRLLQRGIPYQCPRCSAWKSLRISLYTVIGSGPAFRSLRRSDGVRLLGAPPAPALGRDRLSRARELPTTSTACPVCLSA